MRKTVLTTTLFCFSLLLSACTIIPTIDSDNLNTGGATTSDNGLPAPQSINGQKQYINDNVYIYYYGQTCYHCKKIEDYLKASGIDQRIRIAPKEVQIDRNNSAELMATAEELGVPISQVGTPFVVIEKADGTKLPLIGEVEVMNHFKELENQIRSQLQ